MNNIHLRWWGCGAFDVITNDVNIAFDPYLFGENLERAEAVYDYIFISHEHFDHCHPQTLRKLCRGPRFKRLFVSPGCVYPHQPIGSYGDAAFERDLPITKHIDAEAVQIVYPKYRSQTLELVGDRPGPGELDLGQLEVEMIQSGESQRPDLATCGYFIRHKQLDVSFLHTGDLTQPYPSLELLRDRVDFLIHMKMGLTEWMGKDVSAKLIDFIDLTRPRFLIPIHYRTDRVSDPIPHGHWPPDVTDSYAFIESIRRIVGSRTVVLPFTAGIEYELEMPAKKVLWKWNWRNTWTVPPWRES